jgi:4-alpha-glucanotransferase
MRFAALDHRFTGVSVPVASLRTPESCGVGEFADLVPFGQWCRDAGLELIQILPVNDTGGNSSPYSALSAFALHPLYLRVQDLPGAGPFESEIAAFRSEADGLEKAARGRFPYARTLSFKLSLIGRIFSQAEAAIRKDAAFTQWRSENPWVVPYAVFRALRAQTGDSAWSSWGPMADPDPGRIADWWQGHEAQCLPFAWTQFQLEAQLGAVSRALRSMGVALKGDLPILMSKESADVWASRRYFDLSAVAGAPPDMFSPDGQNWGFPVYDWDRLQADGCIWWKDRLRQAGKFFSAFRIDHVLGFFRIWRIPRGERTGLLGRFSPSLGLARADLEALGFDKGRLRWLSVPHVSEAELAALGPQAAAARERYLLRIGAEDLYNLKPEMDSETVIASLDASSEVKSFLFSRHSDRALLDEGDGTFYPAWYMEQKKSFQSLTVQEKSRLADIVVRRRAESEQAWEAGGRELLDTLRRSTDMLVCAEDLGDVPRCVPRVLAALGILGLRIVRWSRAYAETPPGSAAPFVPPARYPFLSVCTPSVHDTTTIRGWWEEEGDRELFFRSLGEPGPCPPHMTARLLGRIVAHCMGASSAICVLQLQDLLDLDAALWSADPREDRVNVPGTVNDVNWTWRMPLSVGELGANTALTSTIRSLVRARRERPVEAEG